MKTLDLGRCTLGIFAATAMLGGCDGSHPPLGGPVAASKMVAIATTTRADNTRLLRKATSSDLLYVIGGDRVYMLSYPTGQPFGSFSVNGPRQLCSDGKGNVFLTLDSDQIAEYPHGSTTPIRTLSDPGEGPTGCSVDPTTGNLAVANGGSGSGSNANVVVYAGGSGSPETFTDASFAHFAFCGYDNAGNLFANGVSPSGQFRLAELPKGSSTFTDITLDKRVVGGGGGSIQWDDKYMALAAQEGLIYRITGSSGHVLGTVKLKARKPYPIFWIQGNRIVSHYAITKLGLWKYPSGGRPISKIAGFLIGRSGLGGVTVSVATTN
ncbi:MAG TPA: hypothetical protein VMT95_01180 [Candidatus Binatia bacterium]|nr:hypothetical protein [Candidatus Binatia bacterium]